MIRLHYLGQKPIGERCFEIIGQAHLDKKLVLCGAMSNVYAGYWWKTHNIDVSCHRYNIPFINNFLKQEGVITKIVRNLHINTIISVQHPWLLSKEILELVNHRAFNLHLAKIQDYRGCNSFTHAILNGEKEYGVTVHWMEEGADTGDIAFQQCFKIENNDTAKSLYDKACKYGVVLFKKLVEYLVEEKKIPRLRHTPGKFYDKHLINNEREIESFDDNFGLSIMLSKEDVNCKSRAFYFPPFEPAYIMLNNKKYYVLPEESYRKE